MEPCCTNTITPTMIRTGQMKIGDRIELEEMPSERHDGEVLVDSPMPASSAAHQTDAQTDAQPVHQPVQPEPRMASRQMESAGWMSVPLTLDQMTPYIRQDMVDTRGSQPTILLNQTPMTTDQFQETIDSSDVQSYLNFLRTQIGRYMRVEQLMGSSQVESRYGFLVGIGTNYIILQEITTGNIMVVDLFTIRLTYIYYSDPVVPPQIQR